MSDRNMDFWDNADELKAELSRLDDLVSSLRSQVESRDAEIARLREERRWVSVGERLPELGVNVLVIGREGVFEARLAAWGDSRRWEPLILDCHGCGCCGGGEPNVTHWMPLPAPPNGGGKKG